MKAKQFFKNFAYAISSNLVSLLISTIVVFIVPKIISIEQYGFFQLYIFYTSYVGVLHFGWFDGIYLRYGGTEYREINYSKFNSQFVMSFILEIIVALVIWSIALFKGGANNQFILEMCAIAVVLVNMQQMLLYILQ